MPCNINRCPPTPFDINQLHLVVALSRQRSGQTDYFNSRLTANHSKTAVLLGLWPVPVCQRWASFRVHLACERACCTISTKTFRVSAALRTSCEKAMRPPRIPSGVFRRT